MEIEVEREDFVNILRTGQEDEISNVNVPGVPIGSS
jgi:hypothetical protein